MCIPSCLQAEQLTEEQVAGKLNPFHAAGDNQKFHKISQNFKILEFGDYNIKNHHTNCIQISANMPDIGYLSKCCFYFETKGLCMDDETNGRVQSIETKIYRPI